MKDKKLHMIGHGHIDPVWLWRWQEGYQVAKATFRSALDRMKEYPEFKFIRSSAALYEWIEENDPAMFEEIRSGFKRPLVPCGGWWVEPDCNILLANLMYATPCTASAISKPSSGRKLLWALTRIASATTGCSPDPEEKRFGLLCIHASAAQ